MREVARAWGPRKRIWLTEHAYQTRPPDPISGVTQARHARLIADAALRAWRLPRVDMLVHYLVRDEPELSRWQSGLYTLAGQPKLAALAFPLPLTVAGRSGGGVVLWGQVRPRSGPQSYRLQARRPGGSWSWIGGQRRTTARGFVSARVSVPRRAQVRLWSPDDRAYSVPVTI